jgi:hypothetical protein
LAPQQRPLRRVAEPAGILPAYDQREEIRYILIKVNEEAVLWMQIDHGPRQPRNRREVADRLKRDPSFSARVSLQCSVRLRVNQARFPSHMFKGARHLIFYQQPRKAASMHFAG